MKYPAWFPFPTCWLKAFLLSILAVSIVQVFARLFGSVAEIAIKLTDRPDLSLLTFILVFLSPIPAIALTHFLIHFLLGKIASKLQSDQVQKHPVLMSVWEGLYGWMAIVIATSIGVAIVATDPQLLFKPADDPHVVFIAVVWLISTAVLYQVEYLVLLLSERLPQRA